MERIKNKFSWGIARKFFLLIFLRNFLLSKFLKMRKLKNIFKLNQENFLSDLLKKILRFFIRGKIS